MSSGWKGAASQSVGADPHRGRMERKARSLPSRPVGTSRLGRDCGGSGAGRGSGAGQLAGASRAHPGRVAAASWHAPCCESLPWWSTRHGELSPRGSSRFFLTRESPPFVRESRTNLCATRFVLCASRTQLCASRTNLCATRACAGATRRRFGVESTHDGATRDGDSPPGRPREGSGRLLSALLTQCLTAAGRSLPGPPAWSCRRRAPAPVRPKTAQIDGRCRLRHHPRQSPPHILTDGCGARSQSNKGRRRRRHR